MPSSCLILVEPYRLIVKEKIAEMQSNGKIYKNVDIWNATLSPMFGGFNRGIQHMADSFAQEYGAVSLGIHWRYNEESLTLPQSPGQIQRVLTKLKSLQRHTSKKGDIKQHGLT